MSSHVSFHAYTTHTSMCTRVPYLRIISQNVKILKYQNFETDVHYFRSASNVTPLGIVEPKKNKINKKHEMSNKKKREESEQMRNGIDRAMTVAESIVCYHEPSSIKIKK